MHETDRRQTDRALPFDARRRWPRQWMDVDWFLENDGLSTFGRGLDLNPRGAVLPLSVFSAPEGSAVLRVALVGRARLFRADAVWVRRAGRGGLLRFTHVSDEDLALLGASLLEQVGPRAIPALARKFPTFTDLPVRHLS